MAHRRKMSLIGGKISEICDCRACLRGDYQNCEFLEQSNFLEESKPEKDAEGIGCIKSSLESA